MDTLWHRVAEGGFLILTEVGTHSGYQTMNEARELLCYNFEKTEYKGHIFSPVSIQYTLIFVIYFCQRAHL